jgi:aminopeptidase YwaD
MNNLIKKAELYLNILCKEISNRSVGSQGNIEATDYVEKLFRNLGWKTDMPEFDAIDWKTKGATLECDGEFYEVFSSHYSLPVDCIAPVISLSSLEELEATDANGSILLLYGDLAREQYMPKNFVFYNPERHQQVIKLLENSGAKALICATGRNSELAGGAYPYPLFEDGDFDIPSVFMKDTEGERLLKKLNGDVHLVSDCERIPAHGYNVYAHKGPGAGKSIAVTAHIDAKKGTPGAIDNATGVIVLLLLAELLKDSDLKQGVDLIAFNGEDYWAVPGQMLYIREHQGDLSSVSLNINIDGAGYYKGDSAFSFFNLPDEVKISAEKAMDRHPSISEGIQWVQGDHSIFVQFGVPAIAVSSQWFLDNMETQDVTHTPKDNPSIVDLEKIVEIAEAIAEIIKKE